MSDHLSVAAWWVAGWTRSTRYPSNNDAYLSIRLGRATVRLREQNEIQRLRYHITAFRLALDPDFLLPSNNIEAATTLRLSFDALERNEQRLQKELEKCHKRIAELEAKCQTKTS